MRNWLVLLGVLAAVLLARCHAQQGTVVCEPGEVCLLCENLTLDRVDRVELDPAEVFTEPGNSFRIAAVPVGANGLPIRAKRPATEPILVTWAFVPYLTSDGGSAMVDIPADAGPQTVSGILATVNGKGPVAPGRLSIGPSATGSGIALQIPHAAGSPPEAVLLDWRGSSATVYSGSRGLAMAGTAWLDDVVVEAGRPQALVFAAGAGLRLACFTPDFTPAARPERSVLVYVRSNLAAPEDEVGFRAAVAKARALADRHFRENRTGISLDWEEQPHPSLPPLTGEFDSCDDETLQEKLGVQVTTEEAPDGETLQAHEAWVVFVPSIPGEFPGYMCDRTPRRGPVIVMSAAHFNPTTLAHELGHMFGMAYELCNEGHTEGKPGFTPANLMWSAPDVCTGRTRERFSLGQIYRMNLDTGSWVWHKMSTGADAWPPDSLKRECQPEHGEGECPALATDYPRGGGP